MTLGAIFVFSAVYISKGMQLCSGLNLAFSQISDDSNPIPFRLRMLSSLSC